jgi:TRAP transporter TAXI family solute receptor
VRPDRVRRHPLPALALAALALLGQPLAAEDLSDSFVSIGTGAADGVYYPIGRGLCRIVNRGQDTDGLRCSVESTAGSVYNARMLDAGELEFAILQGDVLHGAYHGTAAWAPQAGQTLRAVLPLHAEIVTLVADGRLGIESLADLAGRPLNAGHPGSGSRSSFEALAAAGVINQAALGRLSELRASALPDALCTGEIGAFLEVVGHPSGLVRTVRQRCGAALVPLDGPAVDRLVAEQPYLRRVAIPGDLYGLAADVPSFGSHAVLVTRADVGEDVVHLLTSRLLEAFDEVRTFHPTLAGIEPEALASTALAAPLHPGAERAYRERGLLP